MRLARRIGRKRPETPEFPGFWRSDYADSGSSSGESGAKLRGVTRPENGPRDVEAKTHEMLARLSRGGPVDRVGDQLEAVRQRNVSRDLPDREPPDPGRDRSVRRGERLLDRVARTRRGGGAGRSPEPVVTTRTYRARDSR